MRWARRLETKWKVVEISSRPDRFERTQSFKGFCFSENLSGVSSVVDATFPVLSLAMAVC